MQRVNNLVRRRGPSAKETGDTEIEWISAAKETRREEKTHFSENPCVKNNDSLKKKLYYNNY